MRKYDQRQSGRRFSAWQRKISSQLETVSGLKRHWTAGRDIVQIEGAILRSDLRRRMSRGVEQNIFRDIPRGLCADNKLPVIVTHRDEVQTRFAKGARRGVPDLLVRRIEEVVVLLVPIETAFTNQLLSGRVPDQLLRILHRIRIAPGSAVGAEFAKNIAVVGAKLYGDGRTIAAQTDQFRRFDG